MLNDRLLPLDGGFNLRDFGGYVTGDGRRVRRGMLYRSGTMTMLTDADAAHLGALGVAVICDFRRGDERRREPTRWHGDATEYWSRDYRESSGLLVSALKGEVTTAAALRDVMIELYRTIPADHAPAYRAMFERLGTGRVPLLINCSAGKDRTGVGAALVLSVLGVPRETIVEDYLMTNQADFGRLLGRKEMMLSTFARHAPDVVRPLLAADTAYLDAMFTTLDAEHGGLDGYLETGLGVDAAMRDRIRATLLED